MRKTSSMIMALMAVVFVLAACQSTPEEPVVIQKDMEQMIEKAVEESSDNKPVEEVKTTETYQKTISSSAGDVEVNVNAQIVFPEQENIPLCSVKRDSFSQKLIDGMVGILLRGSTLHERIDEMTESAVLDHLEELYRMKNGEKPIEFDGDYDDPEAELDKRIDEYQSILADSPESPMGKEITTELKDMEGEGDDPGQWLIGCTVVEGKNANLTVMKSIYHSRIEFGFSDSFHNETTYFESVEEVSAERFPELVCGLSTQGAQNTADTFLSDIGVEGMMCVDIEKGFAADSFFAADEPFARCYSLSYRRSVNGLPIIVDIGGGSNNEYARPWPPERMSFLIDDSGIIAFQWESPCKPPNKYPVTAKSYPLMRSKPYSRR